MCLGFAFKTSKRKWVCRRRRVHGPLDGHANTLWLDTQQKVCLNYAPPKNVQDLPSFGMMAVVARTRRDNPVDVCARCRDSDSLASTWLPRGTCKEDFNIGTVHKVYLEVHHPGGPSPLW